MDIYFKLETRNDGAVVLVATDKNGRKRMAGNLITFTSKGTMLLLGGVSSHIGLPVDDTGHLIEHKG